MELWAGFINPVGESESVRAFSQKQPHHLSQSSRDRGLLSLRILLQGRQDMLPAAPVCVGHGPRDVMLSEIKQASLVGSEIDKRVKELSNAFFLFVLLKPFPRL